MRPLSCDVLYYNAALLPCYYVNKPSDNTVIDFWSKGQLLMLFGIRYQRRRNIYYALLAAALTKRIIIQWNKAITMQDINSNEKSNTKTEIYTEMLR